MTDVEDLVDVQAEDEALWFVDPTAPESYLQQALRQLHGLIEIERSERKHEENTQ